MLIQIKINIFFISVDCEKNDYYFTHFKFNIGFNKILFMLK